MKRLSFLKWVVFICIFIIIGLFFNERQSNAEGTRDMYDYTIGGSSTSSNVNDRWFFDNYLESFTGDSVYYNGDIKNNTVINVYANEGEKIKFASSGSELEITYPSGSKENVSIEQINGSDGFIYSSVEEKSKSYKYLEIVATETGVYTFYLKNQNYCSSDTNAMIDIYNVNSTLPFSSQDKDRYISAWDIQVEGLDGNDINGRVWMDYVSVYRGYSKTNNNSHGNVKLHILTSDGYTYLMKCDGMDPGGMNFFIGTRGLINAQTNEILYKSVPDYTIGNSVYMPVPTNGETKEDKYGKIFFNIPSDDLPDYIKPEIKESQITKKIEFNGSEHKGEEKSSGIFTFSVDHSALYTIRIKNQNTNAVVREISNVAYEGENTVIWDGKDSSGNYAIPGTYVAELEVRNGEYHFILNDVETIHTGITITSEENESSTIYYDNSDIGGYSNLSGTDSKETPFNYSTDFGDHKFINIWAYTNVKNSTEFFILENQTIQKYILKGLVFKDNDKNRAYSTLVDDPISEVKIKIINETTSEEFEAYTTSNGGFSINVPVGRYTVKVADESKQDVLAGYTVVTNNDVQTAINVSSDVTIQDIGYAMNYKNIKIVKKWDDENNAFGARPDKIHIKLMNGDVVAREADVTDENWEYIFEKVPIYDENEDIIKYTIVEDDIQNYELVETTKVQSDDIETYILKNRREKTKIIVRKVWDDFNNRDGLRPDSININVLCGLKLIKVQELNAKNNWQCEILVDKYDALNEEQQYIVVEDEIENYSSEKEILEVKDNTQTIQFTNTQKTIAIEVLKTWIDNNNADNTRPDSITVQILNNNNMVAEHEITKDEMWKYTFVGLPKYDDDGNVITYEIKENAIDGYRLNNIDTNVLVTSENNLDTFELINEYDKTNIKVNKIWDDFDNAENTRPEFITVQILNGESVVVEREITADDNWAYTFRNLNKFDEEGKEINYFVRETDLADYEMTSLKNNGKLMNVDEEIEIETSDYWKKNEDGTWQSTNTAYSGISGKLKSEIFEVTRPTTLNFEMSVSCYQASGNGLYYTLKNIDTDTTIVSTNNAKISGTSRGIVYNYLQYDKVSIPLENPGRYQIEFVINKYQDGSGTLYGLNSGFVRNLSVKKEGTTEEVEITNKYTKKNITVKKNWDDFNNYDNSRPETITVQLKNGENVVREHEIKEEDNWEYTFKNLDVYNQDGSVIEYTVSENNVEGYTLVDQNNIGKRYTVNVPVTFEESSTWIQNDDETWKSTNSGDYTRATIKSNKFIVRDPTTLNFDMSVSSYNSSAYGLYYIVKNADTNVTIADTSNKMIYGTSRGSVYESLSYDHIEIPISETGEYIIEFYFYKYGNVGLNAGFFKNIYFKQTGYTEEIDITNKYNQINIEVEKKWEDFNNINNVRPESINVQLMNGDTVVRTGEILASNDWKLKFNNLDKYDSNGNKINYVIKEDKLENYVLTKQEETGLKFDDIKEIDFDTSYYWSKNADNVWTTTNSSKLNSKEIVLTGPSIISFDMSVSCYSSSSCGAYYTLTNVDTNQVVVTTSNNKLNGTSLGTVYSNLKYNHIEIPIETAGKYVLELGYEKYGSNTGGSYGLNAPYFKNVNCISPRNTVQMEITNELNTTNLKINKKWNDFDNNYNVRPDSVMVEVFDGENIVAEHEIKQDEDWTYTFKNLKKCNENGEQIKYTVREKNLENYKLGLQENKGFLYDIGRDVEIDSYNYWTKNTDDDTWKSNNTSSGSTATLTSKIINIDKECILSFDISVSSYDVSSNYGLGYTLKNADTNTTIVTTTNARIKGTSRGTSYDSLKYDRVEIPIQTPGNYIIEFNYYRYSSSSGGNYGLNSGFVKNIKVFEKGITQDIDITNELNIINLKVDKNWLDAKNVEGKRPEKIHVSVMNGENQVAEHDITAADDWTYTFTNLKKYDENENDIEYVINEDPIDNYVKTNQKDKGFAIDKRADVSLESVNDWTLRADGTWETVITSNKTDILRGNFTIEDPTTLEFDISVSTYNSKSYGLYYILKNIDTNETIITTNNNKLYGTSRGTVYENLQFEHVAIPIEKAGNYQLEFNYYRYQNSTGGSNGLNTAYVKNVFYKEKANTKNIEITNEYDKVDLMVRKNWNDYFNYYESQPDAIHVKLMNGDSLVDEHDITKENEWEYTFTNIDKFDENGNKINYTIVEDAVNNYDFVDTKKIENLKGASSKINMQSSAQWNEIDDGTWQSKGVSNDNIDRIVSESFTVEKAGEIDFDVSVSAYNVNSYGLYYEVKNVETGETVVTTVNNKLVGIDRGIEYASLKYDHINIPIEQPGVYQIEFCYRRYTGSTGGSYGLNAGFFKNLRYTEYKNIEIIEITNQYNKVNVEVTKIWRDADNKYGVRPESIHVKLFNGQNVVAEHDITAENNWSYVFRDIDKNDENGNKINYSVLEDSVDEYMYVGQKNNGLLRNTQIDLKFEESDQWKQNDDGTWQSLDFMYENVAKSEPFKITEPVTLSFDASVSTYSRTGYGLYYVLTNLDTNTEIVNTNSNRINGTDRGTVYEDLQYDNIKIEINEPGRYQLKFIHQRYGYTGGSYGLDAGFFKNAKYFISTNTEGIEITNELNSKNICVTKTWDDDNNLTGNRPSSINVSLYGNGSLVDSKEITSDNDWNVKFENVKKYDTNGEIIKYDVTEEDVDKYICTNIEKTGNIDKYSLEGKTIDQWSKNDDGVWESTSSNNYNPANITFKDIDVIEKGILSFDMSVSSFEYEGYGLSYSVKNVNTNSVIADTTWNKINGISRGNEYSNLKYEHVDIPIDEPGKYEISFIFNGYYNYVGGNYGLNKGFIKNISFEESIAAEKFNLTNKCNVKNVYLKKVWDDNNNEKNARPSSITVNVKNGTEIAATTTVSESDNWEAVINNLPICDTNGEINYTFEEAPIENYKLESIELKDDENYVTMNENEEEYPWIYENGIWQSGNKGIDYTSSRATTNNFEITDGQSLHFEYAISSENTYDKGLYYIYNANTGECVKSSGYISGVTSGSTIDTLVFSEENIYLETGTYYIELRYDKDSSNSDGADVFCIKNIYVKDDQPTKRLVLTNKYEKSKDEPELVTISGTKTWVNDHDNADNTRPEKITINLMNGNDVIESKDVTPDNDGNWTYSFEAYKYDGDGNEIAYTINEESINDYSAEVSGSIVDGFEITNTYTGRIMKTFIINKVWDDENNKANKRPASVNVSVYRDIEGVKTLVKTYTITSEDISANTWSYDVTDLDKYDENGNEIVYTFEEEEMGSIFYQFAESNIEDNKVTITNKFEVPDTKVNAKVIKVWNDEENKAGKRSKDVTVTLYANGEITDKTYVLNAENVVNTENSWEYTFEGLNKYDNNGDSISYSVQEVLDNNNYEMSSKTEFVHEMGFVSTIINTFKKNTELRDIVVKKVWDDEGNKAGKRPNEITVNLLNGEIIKTAVLNAENNWTVTFEGIPKYNDLNNEIEYTAEETNITSIFYKQTNNTGIANESGEITITNKFEVPDTKVTLDVEKVWDDNDSEKRPEYISVQLLANGTAEGTTITLDSTKQWAYTYSDLIKYDENGNEINYTVKELATNNIYYKAENAKYDKVGNKVTITNKFVVPDEKVKVKVNKIWDDNADNAEKRPETLEIELSNGQKYIMSASDADVVDKNIWTYTFENLEKYNAQNGDEIVYTAVENFDNENYTSTVENKVENGVKVITFTNKYAPNTEKRDILVEKIWEDSNNVNNKRPTSIIVKLSDGITQVGEKTMYADQNGNWTCTFKDLPKYDSKNNEIKYIATEICDSIFYVEKTHENVMNSDGKITITNKFDVPDDTIDIAVNKVWDDENNRDGRRPEILTIVIKNDADEELKRISISGNEKTNEGWNGTFKDMRKYDETTGDEAKYNIDEVDENNNLELYIKSVNGTTITNTYKLNNPRIEDPVTSKNGPEFIYSSDEILEYTVTYTATIVDFYGDANIKIVDQLPYEIDENLSDLNDGTYDKATKQIVWEESINGIDTYTNGNKDIKIVKKFKVKYLNLNYNKIKIDNIAKTETILKETEIKSESEDKHTTEQSIFGKVIVTYIDIDTDEQIGDKIVLTGKPGEEYEDIREDPQDYIFVKDTNNSKGNFIEGTIDVKYMYKKIKHDKTDDKDEEDDEEKDEKINVKEVLEENVTENTTEYTLESVKTGDNIVIYVALCSVSIIVIACRKRKIY